VVFGRTRVDSIKDVVPDEIPNLLRQCEEVHVDAHGIPLRSLAASIGAYGVNVNRLTPYDGFAGGYISLSRLLLSLRDQFDESCQI
jgi:hypothetical protein